MKGHFVEHCFRGNVALITGAASGIGLATAKAFATAGATVVLADRDKQSLRTAAAELDAMGKSAFSICCDVADEKQVADMVSQTVATFGKLDIACNNAGVHVSVANTGDASGEEFDLANAINLRGVWSCMRYQLAQMSKQGSGVIVNVSSQSGLVGTPGLGAYTASKHGVLGLTKSAALEYAARNIRINAVCPGSVLTPMVERALADEPETMQAVMKEIPLGRLGRAEEISSAILWLCSPGASFVIGHALVVDGGYTVR